MGVVGTGSSFEMSCDDRVQMELKRITVKDMEAAGVAYVADEWKLPFVCVKTITDLLDSDIGSEQFLSNLSSSMEALATIFPEILSEIINFNETS
jgi:5'-methylthioadenosine nucleosidase